MAAEPGPRFLTAEQAAAVDAAFAVTLPKAKVMRVEGLWRVPDTVALACCTVAAGRLQGDVATCRPCCNPPPFASPHWFPQHQAPVMVRLVFHDAGSYEAAAGDGGVNASIRFELDRPDNFGLKRGW